MKTLSTSALLLALVAAPAFAQTTATATKPATAGSAAKPGTAAVHHAVAKKPMVCAEDAQPKTPASIPQITGKAKPLYSATLKYADISVGTGELAKSSPAGCAPRPNPNKPDQPACLWYSVKYTGWLAEDGKKFDSSYDHPDAAPIDFPQGIHAVIPGWDTGFEGMHIGGKRRLFIPYQFAYGESGRPPVIPAKADLIFDIELVGISDKAPEPKPRPTPPPAPAKPAAPAADKPAPPPTATAPTPAATVTAPAPEHVTPQSAPAQK